MTTHDPCYKGWKLENGNTAGRCCCSCRYQKPIVSHPWNENDLTRGPITSIIGYGCNMPDIDRTVFFENKHGMCEMHEFKNNVYQLKRVK